MGRDRRAANTGQANPLAGLTRCGGGEGLDEILHLMTADAWEHAQRSGSVAPPSLATEGFVHCSTRAQAPGVIARFYADASDLVAVVIDPARLGSTLRWEPPAHPDGSTDDGESGEQFPHVYAPIPLDAVVEVEPIG